MVPFFSSARFSGLSECRPVEFRREDNLQISAGSEKRAALKAARELLEQDDESIIYVALELRRCLEAIVYEKLWVYRHRLPADSVHKWQPYQAFRALLLMEPDAGFTAMIGVSRQASPESTDRLPSLIGVDHRPKLQWLRATYHKLGSFLHARWSFEKRTVPTAPEDRREFLARLLLELEPFVGPTVTMALPVDVVAFECEFCQTTIQTARCALEELSEVECVGCDCRERRR